MTGRQHWLLLLHRLHHCLLSHVCMLPLQVAEMTGRKGRLVRSGEGGTGVVYEARNASGVDAGEDLIRVLTALSQHEQAYTLPVQNMGDPPACFHSLFLSPMLPVSLTCVLLPRCPIPPAGSTLEMINVHERELFLSGKRVGRVRLHMARPGGQGAPSHGKARRAGCTFTRRAGGQVPPPPLAM